MAIMAYNYSSKSLFINIALALIAFAYVYRTISVRMIVFGVGTTHKNVNASGCSVFGKEIPEIQGCESIQVDPRTGLAYMACGNRGARMRWLDTKSKYNPIYEQFNDHVVVMDTKNNLKILKVLELTEGGIGGKMTLVPFQQDFRVHGFDIYWDNVDPEVLTFMFVNHQRSGNAISIFKHKIGSEYIQHIKTVRSHLLYSPNDVVATSRSTFYATNELAYTRGLMRKIEILLGMPWGYVVHYSHTGMFTKATDGIAYPNGITKSADGGTIYVAASSEPSVSMFKPKLDGTLELLSKQVFRDFVPDNISVDAKTGHILVAGFLNTLEMFRYNHEVLHGTSAQPAAGIRRLVPPKSPHRSFVEENILVHDGRLLPSTTAATIQRHGTAKRILLGSAMADHIAICNVNERMEHRARTSLI
ncbi:hypothetical protein GGI25_001750 [Coemansia spiralis]|uniref:Uncharacterized protein n=2 Tax=Coemansia TaxID=4863 RepID=A0A9W8GAF6_9FUNG|nr:hypothetical protein BX070DRAFT_221220 [Coemansia spiralis]KAJ1990577.1 hypothetical protein EDC05_003997 [Coemansia umbellata]KAJ2624911.1 hypothetical protein GGI26_001023 [Coemansia sp. RSA 1358]KAJ2679182.1 hypothetical protein GGI25_001750 [Coemansia spiralis]